MLASKVGGAGTYCESGPSRITRFARPQADSPDSFNRSQDLPQARSYRSSRSRSASFDLDIRSRRRRGQARKYWRPCQEGSSSIWRRNVGLEGERRWPGNDAGFEHVHRGSERVSRCLTSMPRFILFRRSWTTSVMFANSSASNSLRPPFESGHKTSLILVHTFSDQHDRDHSISL